MFISIIGTRASGKSSVEQYLLSRHHFKSVRIRKKIPDDGPSSSELAGMSSGLISLRNYDGEAEIPASLYFDTPSDLLDYVTRNWRDSFVSCDLDTPGLIDPFMKRPSFLLVTVDAPLFTRYARMLSRLAPNISLEEFVGENDNLIYGRHGPICKSDIKVADRPSSLHDTFRLASVHVVNNFSSISELHVYLDGVNLPDTDRLRPGWDTYFMTLASLASQRSNCMKRRVGAILVRDKRIVSTGYNGTPRNVRNCNEGGCRRCNSGVPSGEALDECLCLHAEENALLEAGRERVGDGAVLYCNTCPCLGCAIKIVQTGIKEVVYNLSYKVDDRTAALFKEAGVTLRQHSPPQ